MKEGIKTKPKESRLVFLTIPCTPQQKPCETVLSSELQIINACVEQTCVFFQLQHVWLLLCTINFFPLTLFIHFTCSFLTRRHSLERWKKCHPHAFSHIWCWCKLHCTNQRMLSGCFFFFVSFLSFALLRPPLELSDFSFCCRICCFCCRFLCRLHFLLVLNSIFFVCFHLHWAAACYVCNEQYSYRNDKKTHCWSDAHVHFLCRKII